MKTENYIGKYLVTSFQVQGPLLIKPPVFGDERGFFTERFRTEEFTKMGLPQFIQENYSRSQSMVLRGLHFQYDRPQGKLVTATRGRILDIAVDIRANSPTFGKYISAVLDGDKPEWLWVPAGFAHGFFVLSDDGADVMYKVDSVYNGAGEGAIRWNDPTLAINWFEPLATQNKSPKSTPVLSQKDLDAPSWADYQKNPRF